MSSGTTPSLVAQRHAAMDKELERVAQVEGWLILPSAIAICTRDDQSDWLLGVGGFGQARSVAPAFRPCSCDIAFCLRLLARAATSNR